MLYKQGPPFYHASYVVIICVVDKELKLVENRRSFKKTHLMGLNRLCETAGKVPTYITFTERHKSMK